MILERPTIAEGDAEEAAKEEGDRSGPASTAGARRVLSRRLAALRTAAGKTYDDVARVGGRKKIERIEDGRGPWKVADVWALCRIYGASEDETDQLADLAEQIKENKSEIWDDYSDLLPGSFGMLVGLEPIATKIGMYDPGTLPGLLQTRATARAIFEAVIPPVNAAEVDRLVAVRLKRQDAVFSGPSPAHIQAILDEGVLARQVGGPRTAAEQMAHLQALAARPRMDLRVLPWSSGAHPAMRGGFIMLGFDDPDEPDVTYVESSAGARLLSKPAQVNVHRQILEALKQQSIPLKEYAR